MLIYQLHVSNLETGPVCGILSSNQSTGTSPAFGKNSMIIHRFGMLWRHVRWSQNQDVRYEGTSYEAHQWKLVEDFSTNFN